MSDTQTLPEMVRAKYPGQYDDLSDADLDSKVRAKYPGVYDDLPKPSTRAEAEESPSSPSLKLAAVRPALAATERIAAQVATSPNIAKTGTVIGRVLGGAAGLGTTGTVKGTVAGAAKGGQILSAVSGAVQRPAGVVASTLERVMPYAQTVSTLAGAQGALDLAQIAEPGRKDIGFLGIGKTQNIPKDKLDAIYTQAIENGIKNFGYSPSKAAAVIAKGDPQVFGAAMTAYMKSRMVK